MHKLVMVTHREVCGMLNVYTLHTVGSIKRVGLIYAPIYYHGQYHIMNNCRKINLRD